jgi:hypothetical protein
LNTTLSASGKSMNKNKCADKGQGGPKTGEDTSYEDIRLKGAVFAWSPKSEGWRGVMGS